ncbi:hypothetical protein LEP1GSC021_0924 [Leptospira noguchii str. 1993005606]|uniref:Uncharacterized protein n=1 Tax=Leptospira noguchii str. 2007001578 TaxID=1049974 RepID=A0ABP2T9H1_9LEPT|nr:hypothetical protein [Leptospira noguchii]EMN00965.1 hypothetical protein LEP1GSC035_3765 [Leptospira noguchii str. 2007001578]EPE82586.1 hypothetical protein LEP1GSC021_0924 [Leptospira noguchii str. 1993005606]
MGSDSIRAIQNTLEMTGELILSHLRKNRSGTIEIPECGTY